MDLAALQLILAGLAAEVTGAHVEVGVTTNKRYNEAYLRLTSLTDPQTHATVSSNGGGTYELRVTDGFYTGHADDQSLGEDDVREYFRRYIRAGRAYLEGRWSIRKSRILRVPILTIHTDLGHLNLASPGHGSTNWGQEF